MPQVTSFDPTSSPILPALSARAVTVAYGGPPVVFDVDVDVPAGSRFAIIGPNGAGKSTLLKAMLGLVPRVAGSVQVFGQAMDQGLKRIAYVPQRSAVDWNFPATAADVVLMGRYPARGWWRRLSPGDHRAAHQALDRVGLADFAGRQIGALSGGQQQRVFLARALAQGADLLLLDEPFAAVDAATERQMVDVFKDLSAAGVTVVAVHHDLGTAGAYFTHGLVMQTRTIACGPIAQVLAPAVLAAAYGSHPLPAGGPPVRMAAAPMTAL